MTLPDIITIQFHDLQGETFHQRNILVGIKTIATHKNDITLSPFLSDNEGRIVITKEDLLAAAGDVYETGLMDYSSLESAKPEIEIIFIGKDKLKSQVRYYEILSGDRRSSLLKVERELTKKELAAVEQKKAWTDLYEKYKNCFNLKTSIDHDITLATDVWDGRESVKHYSVMI